MRFRRYVEKVELLIPPDFEPDTQEIEHRHDPLTNSRCTINIRRAERAKQAAKVTADLADAIRETSEGCFFCPEHIEQKTPRFPENICKEGRIRLGECWLFPNLFPFAEYHAVATLTKRHYLDLDQFEVKPLIDNFSACRDWVLSVYKINKEAKYPIYMWNHMPPSAASIIHPHVQVTVSKLPTSMQRELLERGEQYFRKRGRNYWQDLAQEEKKLGERYIGENDSLWVIASYAPRGFREIQLIFKEASSLTDLNQKQIADFADSITRILHGYKEMGVGSFNLNSFSGPIGKQLDYYSLNTKIISRPFPQPLYTNDSGPFERLQDERVIETLPEYIAQELRKFFQ